MLTFLYFFISDLKSFSIKNLDKKQPSHNSNNNQDADNIVSTTIITLLVVTIK